MGMTIASLLPLIVAAAVLPLDIFVVFVLLRGERGVVRAGAFATGSMGVRLLQGVFFGYIFRATANAMVEGIMAALLLLVVGILSLITAAKAWLREPDPDAPPSRWMTALGGVSALTAFGMGAALLTIAIKQWVFTLSAIAIIDEAELNQVSNVLAYLLFVVAAHSLVLTPVVLATAAPRWSARLLDSAQRWLERNSRTTVVVVSSLLGVWFLWKGATGLIRSDQAPVGHVAATAR
jgi:hypothetical protein